MQVILFEKLRKNEHIQLMAIDQSELFISIIKQY